MAELARRKHDLDRPALPALADCVHGLQPQDSGQPRQRVRRQVLIGTGREVRRLVARLEQRDPFGLVVSTLRRQQQCQLCDSVIVRRVDIDPEHAPMRRPGLAHEAHRRHRVRQRVDGPSRDLVPRLGAHRERGVPIQVDLRLAATGTEVGEGRRGLPEQRLGLHGLW